MYCALSPSPSSTSQELKLRARGSSAFMSAEANDALFIAQVKLKDRKNKISQTSKLNFSLEQDVGYLDQKIALLINHRCTLEQISVLLDVTKRTTESGFIKDSTQSKNYCNFFFLLQTEPTHIARLARAVRVNDIDKLLQTVMFSLYGNQYETREEYLLLSMFEVSLKMEFDEAQSIGSVMRANTAVSRLMTTYTRRGPGQEYLKQTLSKPCVALQAEKDVCMEINPLKVYEEIINKIETETGKTCTLPREITMEDASARTDVQRIIEPRVELLCHWTTLFLDAITSSLDKIPYGIRWICRQIRRLVRRRFPEASEENAISLVSGFFLLRFVNPAVVTPQAYMLINEKPNFQMRNNHKMIAKLLQNLGNQPNSRKEAFMDKFKDFTISNRERMAKFFTEICEVEDFHQTLELENYYSLIRQDLHLNITINEIVSMHELVLEYENILFQDELGDNLKIITNDLGKPMEKVVRAENKNITLPIFSRWEVKPNTVKEEAISEKEQLYLLSRNQLVSLFLLIPRSMHTNINYAVEQATKMTDPAINLRAAELKENIDALIAYNYNMDELFVEVNEELDKIKTLTFTIENELVELEMVFEGVLMRNEYLRQQLQSYEMYLLNARKNAVKSGGTSSSKKEKKEKETKLKNQTGFKFTHQQLEKDGIIVSSEVPNDRKSAIYFIFTCSEPGRFQITMYYKGREKPVKVMELKLEDLLEKQYANEILYNLEYVSLNVNKTLHCFGKYFKDVV